MKQLTCEMCGSTELIKQDGLFVCQACGCKYSVEEAKKLMIEGIVDVQGTVKVDNSAFVEKYLANARRAMQKGDWEETEKYYNMVEQNDPSNIEAIFFSAYGKARCSMIDGDIFKRQQICDVFCRSISIIDDNYNVEKSEENRELLTQMHNSLFAMYNTNFVYTTKTTESGIKADNREKTYYLFAKMAEAFIESITNIINVDDQLLYWKMIFKQHKYLVGNTSLCKESRKQHREIAISIGNKIREKDPNFNIYVPEPSGGCYIATCVYGSYDCPEVWTLRRFRDNTLGSTWYGRTFIRLYYAISPILVKWFGKTNWFKNMWKGTLDKMVINLNTNGVEDTPYNDKIW
jgi:uncharacterized Zn finger protein (UPF0148 family)